MDAAQALLTGFDTALSKQWREEDRTWRRNDMEWREIERAVHARDERFVREGYRWRDEDIEQVRGEVFSPLVLHVDRKLMAFV